MKKGLILGGLVAGFVALFGATNAYAESITVKIDDPDFYAALKNCTQNGITKEEYQQATSELTASGDVLALRNFFRETLYCDNMYLATFDDDNTSFTFENESDFYGIRDMWVPSQGLKNVSDMKKFGDVTWNFAYNEIEYADIDDDVYLSGNPIRKTPELFTDIVNGESYAWGVDALALYAVQMTHLEIEDEYTGNEYDLPEIISETRAGLYNYGRNFTEDLAERDPDSMSPELYEEFVNWTNAIASHYSPENWLYLENATLSDDGKTLKAIDPTKDMLISYRQSWEKTFAESPFLNPCLYPDFYSLSYCENGQPSADATRMLEVELKAFQESDEYADIITIKVKSKNPLNPNTLDDFNAKTAIISFALMSLGAALAIKYGAGRNK